MVYYNSLKTEEERRFVEMHGKNNCYIKKLKHIDEIEKIQISNSDIYCNEDGTIDNHFLDFAKMYANKEVLVYHSTYPNGSLNDNFICGDEHYWVFLDEMFVDSKF